MPEKEIKRVRRGPTEGLEPEKQWMTPGWALCAPAPRHANAVRILGEGESRPRHPLWIITGLPVRRQDNWSQQAVSESPESGRSGNQAHFADGHAAGSAANPISAAMSSSRASWGWMPTLKCRRKEAVSTLEPPGETLHQPQFWRAAPTLKSPQHPRRWPAEVFLRGGEVIIKVRMVSMKRTVSTALAPFRVGQYQSMASTVTRPSYRRPLMKKVG